MKRDRLLFIYNPVAGKELLRPRLSEVIEEFMKKEYEVTIFATRRECEATELVVELAPEFDRVVCSGGDGTMHEVMDGLMQLPIDKRPPCGYIPAGTVNDFATSMLIPADLKAAAKTAVSTRVMTYDVGSMNGNYFNYIAAFGAFTSVSYETPQNIKNILGRAAYILEGMMKVSTIRPYHLTIKGDHDIQVEDDFIFGMVTNAKSVGGFPIFKKTAMKLNDGVFEGVFVKNPKNPLELQSVVGAFLTASSNDQIVAFRSSHFEIECKEELSFTLDGEDGGNYKKVEIINHKAAVTYVQGKPEKKKNNKMKEE